MYLSERDRIKSKIQYVATSKWWGDNFDVRFFLISQIKKIQKSSILDIGGGIGIICSELDNSNLRVNLDNSFDDLKICRNRINSEIQNICASMTYLPFRDNCFQYVICSNVLEVAKELDKKKGLEKRTYESIVYPTVNKILSEANRVLLPNNFIYITTPNNAYYNSQKLTFKELQDALNTIFSSFEIYFFNTFPRLSKNKRKLNMANVIPKALSKFSNPDKVITGLLKKNVKNHYSVSFYVKVRGKKLDNRI